MLQKQLLIAGSVLGTLALGHQAVNADTVPTTTDTSTAQSVQSTLPTVKAVVLSATDVSTSDASSTVDDGTTVDNGGVPNDDGTNTNNGGGSSSNDDGTNTDNGGGSSSSDNGGGSSSSNNNGGSSSSDNGNTSHVVPVTPDNNGNVVNVPTQVASDADVSSAVKAYNQALADNGKDASNEKVVQAKKNLDQAIAKALPKTHATEKSSIGGSGILALAMSGLVALGGLIYKRKHL
ncbi:serine-rich aggregation substance UasX [Leuconostoc citreum]|uniref:serine-rich aggregation substance UasX n=1 Tax=Leuconostoc citreum TaxID=33964 RepID=UPI00167180EE|nr:serine-rich aggregation substance UasX [Leuconostoc citreum]